MFNKMIDLVIWGKMISLPVEYSDSVKMGTAEKTAISIKEFSFNSADITNKSITAVKSYVNKSAEAIGETVTGNLFDYITPHMMLVGIDEGSTNIALLCGFKYDPEHDIAIIFREQLFVEVGSQDLVSWW